MTNTMRKGFPKLRFTRFGADADVEAEITRTLPAMQVRELLDRLDRQPPPSLLIQLACVAQKARVIRPDVNIEPA